MRTLAVYIFACEPPCRGPVIVATYTERKAKNKFPQNVGDATGMKCGKLYKATKETPMYLVGSIDWPK